MIIENKGKFDVYELLEHKANIKIIEFKNIEFKNISEIINLKLLQFYFYLSIIRIVFKISQTDIINYNTFYLE